jgi:hypothetical protein
MLNQYKALNESIYIWAQSQPYLAGAVAVILLFAWYKRPKMMFFLTFLAVLGITIWFWYNESFQKRNENKKFKRYQEKRLEQIEEVRD